MPRVPKQILPPLNLSTESLGQRLARFRIGKGLSQLALAQKIGIDRTVIASYENDRLRMYDDMISRISIALGISTDLLLGLSDQDSTPDTPLRITKRFQKIQTLTPAKQKTVLQALDLALKAVGADPQDS